jgi:ABC-type multidrug transport system permease subunit
MPIIISAVLLSLLCTALCTAFVFLNDSVMAWQGLFLSLVLLNISTWIFVFKVRKRVMRLQKQMI